MNYESIFMDSTSSPRNGRATRSSLACLPCRSRHLKCDGKRPHCARCSEVGKQCGYAPSRRGGLDRAALAERRKQAANANALPVSESGSQGDMTAQQPPERTARHVDPGVLDLNRGAGSTGIFLQAAHSNNIENDPLIDSYYKNFHICHPFILPQKFLIRLYQDPQRQRDCAPLIAVIRFVGNLYHTREWSMSQKESVEKSISEVSPSDPIVVQCRLLYSMALFWYDYKTESQLQMNMATKLATDLQMFRHEFATAQEADDLVLRESWRRTWWMLYIVDAYYAGTLGTTNLQTMNVDATAELPCGESDYESGVGVDILSPDSLMN